MKCPKCGDYMNYEGDADAGNDNRILICECWHCGTCGNDVEANCYEPEDD